MPERVNFAQIPIKANSTPSADFNGSWLLVLAPVLPDINCDTDFKGNMHTLRVETKFPFLFTVKLPVGICLIVPLGERNKY